MESMGNLDFIGSIELCISTVVRCTLKAPADSEERFMTQQTQPNQPQQTKKPGQPNPMPNKPGQSSQQSSSDQHDQSMDKK
jgi:hypothetical protein